MLLFYIKHQNQNRGKPYGLNKFMWKADAPWAFSLDIYLSMKTLTKDTMEFYVAIKNGAYRKVEIEKNKKKISSSKATYTFSRGSASAEKDVR